MVKQTTQPGRARGHSVQHGGAAPHCKGKIGRDSVPLPDIDFIKAMGISLLSDILTIIPLVYRKADFLRDSKTFLARMDREGSTFATSRLPVIFDGVVTLLEGGAVSFPNFKLVKGRAYPRFLGGLTSYVLDHPDTSEGTKALEMLYQISYAFKKVQGPYKASKLKKQLREFIETDAELKEIDYLSEPLRELTREARRIITEITKGLNPFDPDQGQAFLPQPGPGATNTPREKRDRYHAAVSYRSIEDFFDIEEWYRPPFAPARGPWNLSQEMPKKHILRQNKRPIKGLEVIDAPTSRFRFVPKTNQKARGICIEENEIQWLQQALRKGLCDRIESHPVTKGYVNFTSQQINGDLALLSSQTGHLATIDMSSASDRISRKLVSYLFGGNVPLRDSLLAVSTETIELPRELVDDWFIPQLPINKISPMGSAICFPIMALVHFSLIKAIMKFSAVDHTTTKPEVWVYGDDIIIPVDFVRAVYDILPLFGMKFNEEKSFVRSRFRESCGLHAFNGSNITPVRFKIARSNLRLSDVPGTLRLEEAFYKKGFRKTSEKLRIYIQRAMVNANIFLWAKVPSDSSLLGFYRPDEEATLAEFVKVNEGMECVEPSDKAIPYYQSKVFAVPVITVYCEKSPPLDGEPGYLRWLCTQGRRAEFVEDSQLEKTKINWRVIPESGLGFRS